MKLMIGFTTGFVAGAYVFSKMSEDQRHEVSNKLDTLLKQGRTGEVVSTVTNGAGSVADAVTERVKGATDAAAGVATEAVSADPVDESSDLYHEVGAHSVS